MTQPNARTIAARRKAKRQERYRGKLLSVPEILERLGDESGPLPRRTWQEWRACGKAPRCYKLPNGQLRCREEVFDAWFEDLAEDEAVSV